LDLRKWEEQEEAGESCMTMRFIVCTFIAKQNYNDEIKGDEVIQGNSKLLWGFPFISHGNPDNNIRECIFFL
jgi:hypothetical protein